MGDDVAVGAGLQLDAVALFGVGHVVAPVPLDGRVAHHAHDRVAVFVVVAPQVHALAGAAGVVDVQAAHGHVVVAVVGPVHREADTRRVVDVQVLEHAVGGVADAHPVAAVHDLEATELVVAALDVDDVLAASRIAFDDHELTVGGVHDDGVALGAVEHHLPVPAAARLAGGVGPLVDDHLVAGSGGRQ